MWKKQFALGLSRACGIGFIDQLEMLKNTGFDGFFVTCDPDVDMLGLAKKARELDLRFQSVHAPWDMAAELWHAEDEKAWRGVKKLQTCVDHCVAVQAPILVVHPFVGFDRHDVTEIGLARYGQVVAYARERGIKIAFENVEGMEFLDALMTHFANDDTVGFCWDSGHEMCYNYSQNMLAKYGDRLLCTHLNDNLGIKDLDGKITWLDDLHLLPFDGVADWKHIAQRLHKCGFTDILTFELNLKSKPGRHENDPYGQMPYEQYLAMAYARACQIGKMLVDME